MRILITTEGDVEGQVFAPVALELLSRGHEVHVYSKYDLDAFNVEFRLANIPIRPLKSLWGQEEEYDVALVYRDVINALKYHGVPMAYIVFGPNASQQRVIGGQFYLVDLMFVAGENAKQNLRRNKYDGEILVTGLPKYDPLFSMPHTNEKLIVIPDSPNCPRGADRLRYFKILVEIARRHPDHQVWIKPRFLLGEQWESAGFLCGYDKHMQFLAQDQRDLPPNFKVLQTYHSLNELAARSCLMISAPTSALLSQMILHKPALMVSDAMRPTDLLFDAMYRANLETYTPSGCCVWMDELLDHVPQGLQPNPEWMRSEIGPFDGRVAGRIADGLETLARARTAGVNWVPLLDARIDDFSSKLDEYCRTFKTLDGQAQNQERKRSVERAARRGLACLRALAQDLVEDQDFNQEIDLFEALLEDLLNMPLEPEAFFKAAYPLLTETHILMDRFWGYKVNVGYFKAGFETQANDLSYRIGMGLAEVNAGLAEKWRFVRKSGTGSSLLDYMLAGPEQKTDGVCIRVAKTLMACGFINLANRYTRAALVRVPDQVSFEMLQTLIKVCSPAEKNAFIETWKSGHPGDDRRRLSG